MKLLGTRGTEGAMRLPRAAVVLSLALFFVACLAPPSGDDGGATGGGGSASGGGGAGGGGGGVTVDAGVPEKILFAFEAAPSLSVTDPNATRVTALRRALDALPNDPRISVAVVTFSGSVSTSLSSSLFEFTPVTAMTTSDRDALVTRLTSFTAPGGDGGASARDWARVLGEIYALLYRDTMSALTFGEPKARYTVIFVSDGAPSNNQDDALLCGDAVTRIRGLAPSAFDVRFHTVHVALMDPGVPHVPIPCAEDAGIVAGSACAVPTLTNPVCPELVRDLNAERLRRMAVLGGGRSLDFRNTPDTIAAVDFSPLVP